MKYCTHNEQETASFAAAVSGMLEPGDTVLLHGDLGTGKSVLARGIARALGVCGAMPSPTFTLMIPYTGSRKVYHFDLYRLNEPDEFYAAGLDEFIGGDGIAVVEWPEMADIEPDPRLELTLERVENDENERLISIGAATVAGYEPQKLKEWEWKK